MNEEKAHRREESEDPPSVIIEDPTIRDALLSNGFRCSHVFNSWYTTNLFKHSQLVTPTSPARMEFQVDDRVLILHGTVLQWKESEE